MAASHYHHPIRTWELAQAIVGRQLADSLARIKALTIAHEPSLNDLDLEIGHSVDHYFDPRTQAGVADALEREAATRPS